MLEKIVTSLDGIDEKYHELYDKQPDETFKLNTIEAPKEDVTGLKIVLENIKAERSELKERLTKIEEEKKKADEQTLIEQNKYKELYEKTKTGFDSEKTAYEEKINAITEQFKKSLRDREVTRLSAHLFGEDSDIFAHVIDQNIDIEETCGEYKAVFKKDDGSIIDEKTLIDNLRSNKRLQKFIVGRNSSGGSAGTNGGGGAVTDAAKYFDRTSPDYSPMKQAEIEETDKALHDQMVERYKLAEF